MLTKKLTKIGDSTGIVIDKPILDLLGFSQAAAFYVGDLPVGGLIKL